MDSGQWGGDDGKCRQPGGPMTSIGPYKWGLQMLQKYNVQWFFSGGMRASRPTDSFIVGDPL